MSYKLGSLFDGSGGFPLSGSLCGIEPVWASEVEPYPIAVTRSRFPKMKHLGDISKINGAEIEPVDIITFGSPCQDLSVAGKRAGLKHEANGDEETTRSGLFMEAVRIIKEMREATNGVYPRFALWENVPGAFSSNKGADFRVVLEELIRIVEPRAVMPEVPKAGWAYADSYSGDGWSLAYRVFDAQYWGVPQRRRRIHLVVDFRGERAREVLFEREGVRGYFAEGRTPWQGIASDAERCSASDDREGEGFDGYNGDLTGGVSATLGVNCGMSTGRNGVIEYGRGLDAVDIPYTLKIRSGCAVDANGKSAGKGALIQENKAATLAVAQDQYLFQPIAVATQQGGAEISENGICPTITAAAGMSGNNQPWIVKPIPNLLLDDQGGQQISVRTDDKCPTLRAEAHGNVPCVVGFDAYNQALTGDKSKTLNSAATDTDHVPCVVYDARGNGDGATVSTLTGDHENRITDYTSVVVEEQPVYCLQGNGIDRADTAGCNGRGWNDETCYTRNTIDRPAVAYSVGTFCPETGGNDPSRSIAFNEEQSATLRAGATPAVVHPEPMTIHGEHISGTLLSRDFKGPGRWDSLDKVVAIDRAFFNQGQNAQYDPQYYTDGTVPTLVARGPSAVAVRYIVRRLTPTECARLQGFADRWGDIEEKDSFTEEEFKFWHDVRNTHAAINGKQVKEYTEKQMLTWYNKLHTDSAEYKMWGNGIALPPALYCMQGITEALKAEEDEAWML